jgi:hypothetical protein
MMKLKRSNGYTLLELLLSSAIFMLCISLVLLGVVIYSHGIQTQIKDNSEEITEIRFMRAFSKDVVKSSLYEGDSIHVLFSKQDSMPVVMVNGVFFDLETGMLVETNVEYLFQANEIVRTEEVPSVSKSRIKRYKLSEEVWKTLSLEKCYKNGATKILTIGDKSDFQWSLGLERLVIKLGVHSRSFTKGEFED